MTGCAHPWLDLNGESVATDYTTQLCTTGYAYLVTDTLSIASYNLVD